MDLPANQHLSLTYYSVSTQGLTISSLHRIIRQYRNINRLSINLAFQLNLRPRLTLIRLSLIRKPWSSGVQVSHPHYRYLCLHLLFYLSPHTLTNMLLQRRMLPYQWLSHSIASVICFMPVYHPCQSPRPVSCYALFEWMAASKPTSWLSLQTDLVNPT